MKPIEAFLTFTDEKKHSVRFDAEDPINGALTAIYIRNKAIKDNIPRRIRVVITDASEG